MQFIILLIKMPEPQKQGRYTDVGIHGVVAVFAIVGSGTGNKGILNVFCYVNLTVQNFFQRNLFRVRFLFNNDIRHKMVTSE